jgi:hypothetical protein
MATRDDGGSDGARGRRRFLRAGAVAGAGAVAAALGAAEPAGAADGQALVVGQTNTGSATTTLLGSRLVLDRITAPETLHVVNNTTAAIYASTTGADTSAITAQALGNGGSAALLAQADTGYGVKAYGNTGVYGEAYKAVGTGVHGVAVSAATTGVFGEASTPNGMGVAGEGTKAGVYGYSELGPGVWGQTGAAGKPALRAETAALNGGIGVEVVAPSGPALRLNPGPAMPPTTGTWKAGDVVASAGLWFCVVAGTGAASRWVKLSRTFEPLAAPVRVYDSRPGKLPAGVEKSKLVHGEERVLSATVGGAVPPGIASAVQVNLTVTGTGPSGWLSLFATGVPWPGTSSINWGAEATTIANGTTVGLDADGRFTVKAAGTTDVVVDVLGYYT